MKDWDKAVAAMDRTVARVDEIYTLSLVKTHGNVEDAYAMAIATIQNTFQVGIARATTYEQVENIILNLVGAVVHSVAKGKDNG